MVAGVTQWSVVGTNPRSFALCFLFAPGLVVAQVCNPSSVCLTDYNAGTVGNLRANVAANCEAGGAGGSGGNCFTSRRGAPVSVDQMDWDEPETWPAGAEVRSGRSTFSPCSLPALQTPFSRQGCLVIIVPQGHRTFDVVIGADLLYRRSYARKLAVVVRASLPESVTCVFCTSPAASLCHAADIRTCVNIPASQLDDVLRPGGTFLCATPAQREGLPLLLRLLEERGYTVEEKEVGPEWRGNPLAAGSLTVAAGGQLGAANGAGASRREGRAAAEQSSGGGAAAGALPSSAPAAAPTDGLFPELYMRAYPLLVLKFMRAAVVAAPVAAATTAEGGGAGLLAAGGDSPS